MEGLASIGVRDSEDMTHAEGVVPSRGAVVAGSVGAERASKPCSPAEATELIWAGADWIWETDSDLRFSWLSDTYQATTGIDPARVLGRFRFDFLKNAAKDSELSARHLEDLQARRSFRDFVYELDGARAECRLVSTSGFPRFDAAGAFLGYRGIGRNVTAIAASLQTMAVTAPAVRPATLDPVHAESHAERMMAALNIMSDAFCYYDGDDRIVLYNEALTTIYHGLDDILRPGVTFAELIDTGIERDLWELEDMTPSQWRTALLDNRRNETGSRSLIRFRDGRSVLHREMRTDDGGTVAICTDVTEMESRQAKLAKANKKTKRLLFDLERTIDAMNMGVVLLDSDLNAEIINQTFFDLWRLQPGEVEVGSPFRALMDVNRFNGVYAVSDAEWEEYVASRLAEIKAGDVSPREFARADGCTMIYSVTALSGGKRLVTYYDITEMKTRQRELAETHERSRLAESVIDAIKDPIFVKDSALKFVLVNKAFADVFGKEPSAMLGHSGAEYVAPEEARAFEASERQVLATGESYEIEESFTSEDHVRSRIVRKHRVSMESGNRYVAGFLFDVTQMKQRETEAEDARQQLAHVLDSMPAGIIIYDRDDRFVLANRQLQDSLPALKGSWEAGQTLRNALERAQAAGYFRDSGDPDLDALHEADPQGWIDRYTERYHAAHTVSERQGPDGRWSQVYDTRTPDGTFIGVRVDITELKEREAALHGAMRQLDLFRHVLDELPVATNIKADNLVLEYVNKAWCQLTGFTREEAIGKTDLDLFGAVEAAGFAADDTYTGTTGAGVETEEAVTHRDGSVRQLMTRKRRLVSADGTIHLFGSSTDISELKARETLLHQSLRENEVFRSLIDNLPVAIYAKKSDLKLNYVNKGWCDLTGFTEDFALGKTDVDIFGKDGELFAEADRVVLRSGATREFEESVSAPDGSVRYQLARKGAFVASDGTHYLIGSSMDVTEQKQREADLLEAQRRAVVADRAKSEFLANMSHEIRTPMNGVLGMAELLAKSNLDPKQKTFTDIIVKSGNALLTIINDILDFSKIDAGQLTLDPAPFNLSEAIEDVATLISTRAKEKDLELIVRVAPNLHDMFIGDVGRFRQIVTNLIGNAVKFTDSGHVLVDVTGAIESGLADLRIAVTDTGIGIAADKLKLVFEKFSQADASSTRRHEGTGLGLAITSRLVELMGGDIGVESAPGQGSTFWFTLSLPHGGKATGRRVTPIDVSGARILIVDDNAINRAILIEQMASWKFDACAAASGSEGLQVLEAAAGHGMAVDCVVLDYQMPGMSGLEMASLVRSSPRFAEVPIVMLTSVDQTLGSASYRELLIDAQLIKPARSSTLLETLVATIQRHRARRRGETPETSADKADAQHKGVEPVHRPARRAAQPGVGQGLDILVAEDNEVNQLVFTQILAETELTFQIVGNGRLAVEMFRESAPSMILMDISMPEMNGFEATHAIRALERESGRHTPIIGVTAHALKGDRERCIDAGMDDYLPKPISPKALLDKIGVWSVQVSRGQRDAV